MLHTPQVLSPRSSFTGRRKLENFLCGKPTLFNAMLAKHNYPKSLIPFHSKTLLL
jgi:hypothetical protein